VSGKVGSPVRHRTKTSSTSGFIYPSTSPRGGCLILRPLGPVAVDEGEGFELGVSFCRLPFASNSRRHGAGET
jgi:hypothetical protein